MRRREFIAGISAAAWPMPVAWAQTYPTRPVRALVPFPAGGLTDSFARLMVQKLSEHLGKQLYVENVAEASGNIGTGQAAKSAPDGYTVLFALSSFVVNPSLFAKLSYDPVRDFDPVSLAVVSTALLTVNPAVPARTVAELVSLIKANPSKFSFASAGVGTPAHLAGEQFRLSLGLDLVHVPFNGGVPRLNR
jgi:tripartite-type tricarboxylate transporter receptor subunit TctC